MFKRRKPEEAAIAVQTGQATSSTPPNSLDDRGAAPSGVPTPIPTPTAPKEAPTMGRSPFPAPPSPPTAAPAAVPPSAAQRAPMPGSTPGQPVGLPGQPGIQPGPKKDVVERRTLVVGRGISVQGVVQDAERLVVEGTVEATMIHATELSVAPGGVFRGEVEVEDAELAGTVDGTLTARGNLTIRASGRLIGTAKCRRLQVEDGGQVTGRLEMITDGVRASAPALGEPIIANKPAPLPTPAFDPATPPG